MTVASTLHFRVNYHSDTEVNYLTDYLEQQTSVRKVGVERTCLPRYVESPVDGR